MLAGISWPFRIENSGLPASAKGTELIRSALILLLKTNSRSRVRRPTVGTALTRLIFENEGPILNALIEREIVNAVVNFLPQVKIISIEFAETTQGQGNLDKVVRLNIIYQIQGVVDETGTFEIGGKG